MRLLLATGVAVGVLISGCSADRGDVIKLTLTTGEVRAETCYLIEVLDEAGTSRSASLTLARDDTKTTYLIAIAHPGFPQTVTLRATALIGADCDTATRHNGVASTTATFDAKRIVEASLSLAEGDVDNDGFVATAKGGEDCNDADDSVSPAAKEQCFGTVDHDCNGKSACSDPACLGMACAGVPTQLAITDAPASIHVSECAGPITVVVRDAMNALTSPAQGATLMLGGPFAFFTDGMCSGASTMGIALESSQSVWVRAAMPQMAQVTVTSAGLSSDTRTINVLPSAPAGLVFANTPVRVNAGGCSPELTLALVDDAGARTFTDQPIDVALSNDAGASFYADLACMQQVTSVQIRDGGVAGLHYFGTTAGQFTLRAATSTPFAAVAEQAAVIDPGAVVALSVTGPSVIAVGECGGPFVVSGRDMYGNAVPVTNAMATVAADAGVTVFTSAACAMPGQPGSSFGLVANAEGQVAVTLSAGGQMTTLMVSASTRGPAGSRSRWPLSIVTTGLTPTRGYVGYTLQATFDSRDGVDAGLLNASASDLRVFFQSDAGWVEVDRLIEGANTATTLVRFPAQAELTPSVPDKRYAFFSGPFDGGAALARPDAVYLFTDDFEAGNLARWSIRSGGWTWANDRQHGGTGALKFPTETNNVDRFIELANPLNESDVMFEAWWNTSNAGDSNFSQCVRVQPSVLTHYETTLEDNSGWDISRMTNGSWTELANNAGTLTQDQWIKVGIAIRDRDISVFRNGVRIINPIQVVQGGPTSGSFGFRKWSIGGALWIDDVTVRRWTDPDPAVTVSPPVATPP